MAPVSRFLADTLAEETAAPEGSETVPLMLEEPWATASGERRNRMSSRSHGRLPVEQAARKWAGNGLMVGRLFSEPRDRQFNTFPIAMSMRLNPSSRTTKICGWGFGKPQARRTARGRGNNTSFFVPSRSCREWTSGFLGAIDTGPGLGVTTIDRAVLRGESKMMTKKSPCAMALAMLLSWLMAMPADGWAAPEGAGHRAGEVSRVIPAVNLARGGKTIPAAAKTVVDWQDLVNTQVNARARIALDDGSVLNVGSDSSVQVIKHDAGAQQTELELSYGKLRTQAQKISKTDGKFEVRTPAGVAGVVGTDFFVEYANNAMNVIVFEGLVKVCNLAAICVMAKAGQMSSVRSGDNSAPLPPQQATLDVLVSSSNDTSPGAAEGATAAAEVHLGVWGTLGILAGAVGTGLGVGLTRGGGPKPPQ